MQSRNKKGIEPIVAAILLIVITVAASVLLYMWFSGYLTATTSKVSSMATPEEFIVTAASLSATNGLTAYVENTGSVTITITGVYVLNATTGSLICYININPTAISPGQTVPIKGTLPTGCAITPNDAYSLKFVTSKGTQYTTSVIAST
ncbi:MAG: archaellin/type IV pilin N-terminal domain-containing protein [Vulcanisaeta sp.]